MRDYHVLRPAWQTLNRFMVAAWKPFTNATPRLANKFNYCIVWAEGTKGSAKLQVENYGHGSHARYNSMGNLGTLLRGLS